ncbi:MAG: NifB/NifX family molybdenum-iron cluster-binding protein [Bacillota bacterium]
MKIAIPISGEQLCTHFGHCEKFYFYNVDQKSTEIAKTECLQAPPHEPGLLPTLLGEKGVNVVMAGGMGARAQELFIRKGIKVITGIDPAGQSPEDIVKNYLRGSLRTGANPCDH